MSKPAQSERAAVLGIESRGSLALGVLALPLRLALGGIFVFAAYKKIIDPRTFSHSVLAFDLGLPDHLTMLSVYVTPWLELLAGVALIVGLWTRAAALTIAGMLVVFIGMYASVLTRGLNVECGCFGDLSPFCPKKVGVCHLVQNGVMLLASLIILMTRRVVLGFDQLAGRR